MVHQSLVFIIFLLLLATAHGQDERYYRQILSGDLPKMFQTYKEAAVHQFNVQGPAYRVDLNDDGIEEIIRPQKRDGVDWLEIQDSSQRKLFERSFLAMGAESSLYKIKLVNLSPKVKTLIIFLDEGKMAGKRFESTAKIFLLSYENNDFSTFKLKEGPHFFHEKESQREQYFRRDYLVDAYDLNNDGQREVVVHYNSIQRIFEYKGNGFWRKY